MISPCIDVLCRLSTQLNAALGAKQGTKHTSPSLERDIGILVCSLKQHRVYELQPGHIIEDDKAVVPDSYTAGLEALKGPLADFNREFAKLQARCKSIPLVRGRYPGTKSTEAATQPSTVMSEGERSQSTGSLHSS